MRVSDKIEQVSASLFAVHRDLKNPTKDSKADAGKFAYTYLSLPALIDHLRPMLKDAQLYLTQEVRGGQGYVEIVTTVWHLSGQFLEFGPAVIIATGDAQQQGAAITYARRYALAAVFNLAADEDDDAAPKRPAASPALGKQAPPGPPQGTLSAPEALEEGANGAEPLATKDQWANLLSLTSGKTAGTAEILNEKNGTNYESYRDAVAHATWAELAAVLP